MDDNNVLESAKNQEALFSEEAALSQLILRLREVFANGENVMEHARRFLNNSQNTTLSILIAYDLQAGSYIEYAQQWPNRINKRCEEVSDILNSLTNGGVGR